MGWAGTGRRALFAAGAAALAVLGCERCDCGSEREPASGTSGSRSTGAASASGAGGDSSSDGIGLSPAFGGLELDRPLWLTPVPGTTAGYVVLEQRGVAWLVRRTDDGWERSPLLDIRERVRREHNEEGLLCFAFHPDFPDSRNVYVYYSTSGPRRTVLTRFMVPEGLGRIDANGEKTILAVEQPYGNHNGGTVLFGPDDGYLYLGLGDGGAGGDPHGHGQNLSTLLGSIIRIDVDRRGQATPYAIPEDNPFVDREGARAEIWAYGLRNPWRMSFDRETGTLWAADVGQNAWEEIDIIERGGNYGWNLREGSHPFEPGDAPDELIDPVFEYGHDEGQSITGGYVYRGTAIDALRGSYVFADFVSGRIWALRYEDGQVREHTELVDSDLPVSSFGEGHDAELYLTAFDGHVYRLTEPD